MTLGARQSRQLRAELARDQKKKAKAALELLRQRLKSAKGLRRGRLKHVRAICRRAKKLARTQVADIRRNHREAANLEIDRLRREEHGRCQARKDQAVAQAENALERAAAKLAAELDYQRQLKIYESPRHRKELARKIAAERRAESDDAVAANLPPELEPVWRRLAPRFKPSDRRSRTEAFTEWAHQHTAQVREIMDEDLERSIAELIKQEKAQRAALRSGGGRRRSASAHVPF